MRQWWKWRKREEELEKEIQHHLRMAEEERVERGASRGDAAAGARREFGNIGLAKELARDMWGWRWLEDLVDDVRYGVRVLRQNPAFTLAAVLAIALGVGINVGIFSVLNAAALRMLPIPRADQIVSVNEVLHGHFSRNVHGEGGLFSYPEYLDYRDHSHVFSGLTAYDPFVEATLAGGKMEQLLGALTSCNYFDVLNEHPALGRGFIDHDCAAPGANAVVIISDDLWRRTFGADPSLVGKAVVLNETSFTVIGIGPPGFTGTEIVPTAFWAPVTMQKALDPSPDEKNERLGDENLSWLAMLGRVQPGVTTAQVRADLSVIAGRLDTVHAGRTTSLLISTATIFGRPAEREVMVPVASVVLAAFGLVLLIACANVSNLLLARASIRHKEIALRLSIGASRGRLVRQLLTESLLLALAGGVLGSLLAFWSFAGILHFVLSHLPASFQLHALALNVAPDIHVLVYALLLTVVTGIAFGLIPALKSSRLDLNTALKGDGTTSATTRKGGKLLRAALVGAQVAVCMILLLSAGLLLRGLYHAQSVDPGFDTKNVASAFFDLQSQGYGENRAAAFIRNLRGRTAAIPGVMETAQAESAPLSHDFSADHFAVSGSGEKLAIEYNHVSPEFFSVVGVPIVRGRGFGPNDWRDGRGIIVTEATARRLWPGQDPLGRTVREDQGRGQEDVVIGVAKDAQVSHLGDVSQPYLYFPAGPRDRQRVYVLARFAAGYPDVAKGMREAVQALDANMPVDVVKLEDYLDVWRAPSRIASALAAALGGLALLLASIGVYGMVSYMVSRSVREIGIRMALGADRRKVMRHVLRQAMRPVVLGGLIGVAGCAAVSWVLSSMLFGLNALDPVAFVTVPLFLMSVALLASYLPARRAMCVDPVVALRYE